MKLKENSIGVTFWTKQMGNITIENDRKKFKLYKNLGLDVFEAKKKKEKKEETE
jgi:hypothetical protein